MEETTTTRVVSVDNGTVTISTDKYHELLESAKEKAPIIYKNVIRTPEMVADANMLRGGSFMAFGAVIFLIGAAQLRVGMSQAAKLAK